MMRNSSYIWLANILLLLFTEISSCNSQTKEKYLNVDKQAVALKEYYEKANNSTGEERAKYEQLFFDVFPSSFQEMQQLFGYDEKKGAAPLYDYEIERDMDGKSMILFFSNLKHISKDSIYNKYIDICIGGKWEADNISEGFGISAKLYYDTEAMISILSKRTDKEIISVFCFVFDGPHPNNRRESYESLHAKVEQFSPKMASLMEQAYKGLLAEDDGHGH